MLAKCEFQGIAGGTFLYITFFEGVMLKIFIFKSVFLLSIGVTTWAKHPLQAVVEGGYTLIL